MDVAQKNLFVGGCRFPHRRFALSPLWKAATTFIFAGFILTALPLSAQVQKADPVIYPRGTAATDAPIAAGKPEANSSLYLAVALLLGAGGWWLWLKRKGGLRGGLAGAAHLTIAETKSLGSRQYLVVADYEGKKFLLGVCPGSIELLTSLDGEKRKE
jgi:flagellar protein FliO/FliZ